MGQGQSQEQPEINHRARVKKHARRQLSELDVLSLKEQTVNSENLAQVLGIEGCTGADVFLRSAQFFASFPIGSVERTEIVDNIPVVLGFFNQSLLEPLNISQYDFHRLMFLSIAATGPLTTGWDPKTSQLDLASIAIEKYYIAYQDLLDLWTLLVAVFDKSPAERFTIDITPKDRKAAERLIKVVKSPVISFSSFEALLKVYPSILLSLNTIFAQLLYPHRSESDQALKKPDYLPRDQLCELYLALGPDVFSMIKLYKGSENGYSMQALHSKVADWRIPSLLIVSGHPSTASSPLFDNFVPKIPNVRHRDVKKVVFAVYIHSGWRQVGNFGDAETKIIQLSPTFNVYNAIGPTDHAYFSVRRGLSFGVPLPKDDDRSQSVKVGNVSLILDNSFENGVFRQLGPGGSYSITLNPLEDPYEDRFSVTNVELWGIGNKAAMTEQYHKLELKEKLIKDRRHRNDPEDRALLELAGLVGQYPQ